MVLLKHVAPGNCMIKIDIINNQRDIPLSIPRFRELVLLALSLENCDADEVAIHFVTKRKISDLHGKFFDDPTPTDCISFPMDEESMDNYRMLGEVFVCPRVAMEYVALNGGDPYQETALYVIHGLLHLMGYDDIEEKMRKDMRKAEMRHIRALKKRNFQIHPLKKKANSLNLKEDPCY